MMKHSKNYKPKHTVKFIRVLNQPATWIEVNVVESADKVREKFISQFNTDKPVQNLLG
jgi:5'(3')-deoxyribonucleotidase